MKNHDGSTHRVNFREGGWMNCHCGAASDHWKAESAVESRARELMDEHCRAGDFERSDVLAAITAALAPQWQPIESAPKDGTFYLATNGKLQRVENCPPGHVAGIWHRIDGDWRGHALGDDSTHWQPLPAPPEVSNGQ